MFRELNKLKIKPIEGELYNCLKTKTKMI